jgi:hypothetical protein
VSKNDYVFTPSILRVKQKAGVLKALNAAECTIFTSRCPEFVHPELDGTVRSLAVESKSPPREHGIADAPVKIPQKPYPARV